MSARHEVHLVGPGIEPVRAFLTDAEEDWIHRLSEVCDEARATLAASQAEVGALKADVERLEALFQQTHGVHWSWVAKATEADRLAASLERARLALERIALPDGNECRDCGQEVLDCDADIEGDECPGRIAREALRPPTPIATPGAKKEHGRCKYSIELTGGGLVQCSGPEGHNGLHRRHWAATPGTPTEHTDVEPHLRTEAERKELFPLLDQLAYKMCMTQAFIIGTVRDAGLTLVPLNPHAREIFPVAAPIPAQPTAPAKETP